MKIWPGRNESVSLSSVSTGTEERDTDRRTAGYKRAAEDEGPAMTSCFRSAVNDTRRLLFEYKLVTELGVHVRLRRGVTQISTGYLSMARRPGPMVQVVVRNHNIGACAV
jgi:hypothetical protein